MLPWHHVMGREGWSKCEDGRLEVRGYCLMPGALSGLAFRVPPVGCCCDMRAAVTHAQRCDVRPAVTQTSKANDHGADQHGNGHACRGKVCTPLYTVARLPVVLSVLVYIY